jgi:hypothetical protein
MSNWDRLDRLEAMEQEMNSQIANGTWELVKRPQDKKILNNMWVYRAKKLSEGKVRFKARLVVK